MGLSGHAAQFPVTASSLFCRPTDRLLNQTFTNNKTALHAYKKNWRYGEGGVIFLGKSTVSGGETSAAAEKRSVIQIFDSYLETTGQR